MLEVNNRFSFESGVFFRFFYNPPPATSFEAFVPYILWYFSRHMRIDLAPGHADVAGWCTRLERTTFKL